MKAKISLALPVLISILILSSINLSIAQSESFNKNPDKGIVYLYRPGKAVGAAVKTQIQINGQNAGGTANNSYFKWELDPGRYVFSCYSRESSPAIEIDVAANQHYFIRQDEKIGLTEGGRVTLKQMEENKGMKGVKKCKKKLVSTYMP